MRKFLWPCLLAFILLLSTDTFAQVPDWVLADWEHRASEGGIWKADNSAYKNEQEPFEAYGLHWEWGLGKRSLQGRLFCIQNGKDVRTVWTFQEYWDAKAQKLVLIQTGADGTVGKGHAWQDEEGGTRSLQNFVSPDGTESQSGHRSRLVDGDMHASSFDVKGDEWTPRRSYVWKRESPLADVPTPDEYKAFEFLIGTWRVDLGEMGIVDMSFEWGQNKLMIHYKSSNPHKPGAAFDYEVKGMIAWHGVKEQLVFMSAYLRASPSLMNEGHFEFPKPGVIERIFTVYYQEGDGIPWTNGERAPKGGKAVNFKQIWTKVDENTFSGQFFWLKAGKWEHPYPFGKDGKETWTRVK